MRLILLTAHNAEGEAQHRYVAKKIAEAFPEELHCIVVATGRKKSLTVKLANWTRRYNVWQIASRTGVHLVRRLGKHQDRQQAVFRSILFRDNDDGLMPARKKLVMVDSHNSDECLALLQRVQPDIVVVYGTLIIGQKLISASKRIINLHTGLSPNYRGSDTIFWPLHNGEPEQVGVTVHRLERGIDSGPVLARGRPQIGANDNVDEIFAKSVMVGAQLLCRAIRREFDGTAQPITQQLSKGHEYRSADRTLAADRRMRRNLKTGLLRGGIEPWQEEF